MASQCQKAKEKRNITGGAKQHTGGDDCSLTCTCNTEKKNGDERQALLDGDLVAQSMR